MEANGEIIVKRRWENILPGQSRSWVEVTEWTGGDVALVDRRILPRNVANSVHSGDHIQLGPYRASVIGVGEYKPSFLLVTRDLRWAWLYRLKYEASRRWYRFFERLIVTLFVWGLADYDQMREPRWRDVHAIAWLLRKSE